MPALCAEWSLACSVVKESNAANRCNDRANQRLGIRVENEEVHDGGFGGREAEDRQGDEGAESHIWFSDSNELKILQE